LVTFVLKNLFQSDHVNEVVFKGGTSLSKAYNCIERFSEDIDLALLKETGANDNQLKKKMKSIEETVTKGLLYFQHEKEEKRGRNRRTFYQYPKGLKDADFGQAKVNIQLEINTFTNPVPHQEMSIDSYVSQFLDQGGFGDRVVKFDLQPFAIKVLNLERTFFEKLLSLIRLSYEGPERLKEKIRHYYDLYRLDKQNSGLLSTKNFEIVDMVKADDDSNEIFRGDWMKQPLAGSPLFSDVEKSWKEVEPTYKKDLPELVWDVLPESEEILKTFSRIKVFLTEHDMQSNLQK
jgi:predicted nucleotidyltransferase component of viral defense system